MRQIDRYGQNERDRHGQNERDRLEQNEREIDMGRMRERQIWAE